MTLPRVKKTEKMVMLLTNLSYPSPLLMSLSAGLYFICQCHVNPRLIIESDGEKMTLGDGAEMGLGLVKDGKGR